MAEILNTDRAKRRPPRAQQRTVAVVVAVTIAVVLLGGVIVAIESSPANTSRVARPDPPCHAVGSSAAAFLDLEQAANATTIAAVGKNLGVADHGVTIALAAALQESGLHNLSYGDRDSLGLFQQRPSQGWGTPAQIMIPRRAAAAFYRRLTRVAGWQAMQVTAAAQMVQHSAAPDAYAQWEPTARVLAEVLTGEVAAGLGCRTSMPSGGIRRDALAKLMVAELGSADLTSHGVPARGWTAVSWIVGHAHEFSIPAVTYSGQTWSAATGRWTPTSTASADASAITI